MHTWIIGAGGLLGSALVKATPNAFIGSPIPWADPAAARAALNQNLRRFAAQTHEEPWRIIWAAGRATTATSPEETAHELAVFKQFITALAERPPKETGTFTLTSSAGGIYAGSSHPPFTSGTKPNPVGAYGHLKLAQEQETQELNSSNIHTAVVRIANLYGPGQDLRKLQGIVSRLCWAAIKNDEVNIFVPLDTLRDYIFVDDAAAHVLHWSGQVNLDGKEVQRVRVVASGQPMSLGHVINTVRNVLHMRVPLAFGSHENASIQTHDLRLIPDTDEVLRALPTHSFPAGIRLVFEDLLASTQNADKHFPRNHPIPR